MGLRLGVHGLSAAEAGLVRALVLLAAHGGTGFRWTFAVDGPFDALIVGSTASGSAPPARFRGVLADRGAMPPAGTDLLERPLHTAGLEAWLHGLEQSMDRDAAVPPAARATDAAPAFILKRWPPEALLRNDPRHVRAATLLARRSLPLRVLAARSGLGEQASLAFVRSLQEQDLLEETAAIAVLAVPEPGIAMALRERLLR